MQDDLLLAGGTHSVYDGDLTHRQKLRSKATAISVVPVPPCEEKRKAKGPRHDSVATFQFLSVKKVFTCLFLVLWRLSGEISLLFSYS
jgi:hypothetical protein